MHPIFLSTNSVKNIRKLLLPLLAALTLASCASKSAVTTTPPLPGKGQVWQLVAIQGRPLTSSADNPITIVFNPEAGTLHGHMACNTYSADYRILNLQLSILNLQTTDIQCTETGMNVEERYLSLLAKCTHISPTPTTLTLSNPGGKPLLQFELQ